MDLVAREIGRGVALDAIAIEGFPVRQTPDASVVRRPGLDSPERVGLTAERFNAQVYSRSMAARFPKDWRESKEQRVTGADGGAVQIENGLTPDQLASLTDAIIIKTEGK